MNDQSFAQSDRWKHPCTYQLATELGNLCCVISIYMGLNECLPGAHVAAHLILTPSIGSRISL